MDDDKVVQVILQAAEDGALQDVLDWDVYIVRNDGTAKEELWEQLKGKIVVVFSALFPETATDDKPGLAAGVYSLDPEDARQIGRGLIAFADTQNPQGGN